jgi:hypothetical protein
MLAGVKMKTVGTVMLVVGIVLLILSLARDLVLAWNAVFGPLQIVGAIAGTIIAIVGLVLILKK